MADDNFLDLETDEDFDDVDVIAANGNPIYGKQVAGSLGKLVTKSDLAKSFLLVLKADVPISLIVIAKTLIERYKLNFITSISFKVRNNGLKKICYVMACYEDEIKRFCAEILHDSGHSFLIANNTVHVKALTGFSMSNARVGEGNTNCDDVINIYFQHAPINHVSPSMNLLAMIDNIHADETLRESILGISLKLNLIHCTLYQYGTLICADHAMISELLPLLRSVNVPANIASFSSFVLPNNIISQARSMNPGQPLVMTERMRLNNILVTESQIDKFVMPNRDQFPALNFNIDLLGRRLRPIIVEAVREAVSEALRGRGPPAPNLQQRLGQIRRGGNPRRPFNSRNQRRF